MNATLSHIKEGIAYANNGGRELPLMFDTACHITAFGFTYVDRFDYEHDVFFGDEMNVEEVVIDGKEYFKFIGE